MVPTSSGSATKVAEAAKSMNSSSTMICMGEKGKGIPKDDWDKKDGYQRYFACKVVADAFA